jgi:hypothetical protein
MRLIDLDRVYSGLCALVLVLAAVYSGCGGNPAGGTSGTTVSITLTSTHRIMQTNAIPDHSTGAFPNANNPNAISAQSNTFEIPINSAFATTPRTIGLNVFGVSLRGISFDPNAAEFWNNDISSGWNLDAIPANLGFDFNNAHVQPTGEYHYHGVPTSIVSTNTTTHSALVGYAADGYAIYSRYGYTNQNDTNSAIKDLQPSYRLKTGTRPSGPGGTYDGTYVEDYEYVNALGDLDECNGRTGFTPESGANVEYAYFLTSTFPLIPRCWKGTPDTTFVRFNNAAGLPNSLPGGP